MMVNKGEDYGFIPYFAARKTTRREDVWKVDHQTTGQVLILHVGITVRQFDNKK